ncbi:HET-domain-containing protein [Microthyrium microscopicum]|uniref:HET-domain-containing protein n=1 Tax=Microthyrium microscopicum TaxID=703497 RepID=A0A6A6UTN0_9PEZI|nr:HET-domain-containing protein [Microthyrium microscopicum]
MVAQSASTSSEQYIHNHLKLEHSIRVLKLLPSKFRGATLHVELSEIPLPDSNITSTYEALSYTWGQKDPNSYVLCHGKRLSLTPNGVAALQQIRNKRKSRILWMDAICIDQSSNNNVEKSSQVGQMGKVYHKAKKVIVWLGPGTLESDAAMRVLKLMSYPFGTQIMGNSMIARLYLKNPDYFKDLFARAYFQRAWTLQEWAAASRIEMLCGTKSLKAKSPKKLKDSIPDHTGRAWLPDSPEVIHKYFMPLPDFEPHDKDVFKTGSILDASISIQNMIKRMIMISAGLALQAQDDRDKVFALQWILQSIGVPSQVPDYSKGFATVMLDFSKLVINHFTVLDVLLYSYSRKDLEDSNALPSWCLSMEPIPRVYEIFASDLLYSTGGFTNLPRHNYADILIKACSRIPQWRFEDNKLLLPVHHISRVVYRPSPLQVQPSGYLEDLYAKKGFIITMVSHLQSRGSYNNDEEFLGALKIVLSNTPARDELQYLGEWHKVIKKLLSLEHLQDLEALGEAFSEKKDRLFSGGIDWIDWILKDSTFNRGLTFFIDSNGRLGLAPDTIKEGDVVMGLYHAMRLFILRPCGSDYKLVGPTFMDVEDRAQSWREMPVESIQMISII